MKTNHPLALSLSNGLAALCLLLAGCNYDFPLTEKPTHKIDPLLVGNWVTYDQNEQKLEQMSVRRLDDFTYAVVMDHDAYRVFHSDFAGTQFVSVQDLQPGDSYGKYAYYVWELSADGRQLTVKGVRTEVVSEDTKGREAIQKLLKANLTNPKLYGDALVFTPKKR
jgi:hypothetical protein